MRNYAKGYKAENEMLHLLYSRGWAVIRAPRSGRVGIPTPDIIAVKGGKIIAIECKSRASAFTVEKEQLEQLDDWELRAGASAYIGWKIVRKGWSFLKLKDVKENKGNVGKKFTEANGITIEVLDPT